MSFNDLAGFSRQLKDQMHEAETKGLSTNEVMRQINDLEEKKEGLEAAIQRAKQRIDQMTTAARENVGNPLYSRGNITDIQTQQQHIAGWKREIARLQQKINDLTDNNYPED